MMNAEEAHKKRSCPLLATDALVLRNNKTELLIITRGKEPQKGTFAVPGGHVDYGEDPQVCVLRELEEECTIKGTNAVLQEVRGDPKRDPRYHVVSIVYSVDVGEDQEPKFADDAASAQFYKIEEIKTWKKEQFFGDHYEIVNNFIKKL